MRRLRPQVFVRQSRVVKLHEYDPGGFERMTKELTASAPSAMTKEPHCRRPTLPLRGSAVPAEGQQAPRRKHLHC